MKDFTPVRDALDTARGIVWDGCHKIYLLMDDEQVELTRADGYPHIITADEMTPSELNRVVLVWYENSCTLRFVEAVFAEADGPFERFEMLIEQDI